MIRKQYNTNSTKTLSSKAILVAVVVLCIFFLTLTSVLGLWSKYRAIRTHIKELRQQESLLKEKNAKVSRLNEYINTTEGKEQVYRDTYRLIKPNEGIVVITKENRTDSPVAKSPAILQFWKSILTALGLK